MIYVQNSHGIEIRKMLPWVPMDFRKDTKVASWFNNPWQFLRVT